MRAKGKNKLLAWMLLLAMLVADLPVLPGNSSVEVQAADETGLPVSDEFNGTELNRVWEKYQENTDKWRLKNGCLQIDSSRYDWWESNETTFHKPNNIFYQSANGDWESITHVTYEQDLSDNCHAVGIMVADRNDEGQIDEKNYLWFRYEYINRTDYDSGKDYLALRVNKEVNNNNKEIGVDKDFTSPNRELYFKVTKVGNYYSFEISVDGKNYKEVCDTVMDLESPVFAVSAYNSSNGKNGPTSITTNYDYVHFKEPDLESKFFIVKANNAEPMYSSEVYNKFQRSANIKLNDGTPQGIYRDGNGTDGSTGEVMCKIYVERAGNYNITPYLAKGNSSTTSTFGVEVDGEKTFSVTGKNTEDSWYKYKAFCGDDGIAFIQYLTAGVHKIKLTWSGRRVDLGYVDFVKQEDYQFFQVEAELGVLSGESKIAAVGDGDASNSHTVNFMGGYADGSSTLYIHAKEEGVRTLRLYHATGEERTFQVNVTNENKNKMDTYNVTVTNPNKFNLSTDKDYVDVEIDLWEGKNEVTVHGVYPNYAPNFDRIKIDLTKEEAKLTTEYMIDAMPYAISGDDEKKYEAVKKSFDIYGSLYGASEGNGLKESLSDEIQEKWRLVEGTKKDEKDEREDVYEILKNRYSDLEKSKNDYVVQSWNAVENAYSACSNPYTTPMLANLERAMNNLVKKADVEKVKDVYNSLSTIVIGLKSDASALKAANMDAIYPTADTDAYKRMLKTYEEHKPDGKGYNLVAIYNKMAELTSDPITANDMLIFNMQLQYLDTVTKEVLDLRFEKLKNCRDILVADAGKYGFKYDEGKLNTLNIAYNSVLEAYKNTEVGAVKMNELVSALEEVVKELLIARKGNFETIIGNLNESYYANWNTLTTPLNQVKSLSDNDNVFVIHNRIVDLEGPYTLLSKKSCWVTIDLNNGEEREIKKQYTAGDKLDAGMLNELATGENTKVPTKENRVFAGWYYNDAKIDSSQITVESSLNIKAKWYVTVTFDLDGGQWVGASPQNYILEGEYVPRPESPTRDGYTFRGWKLVSDRESLSDEESNETAGTYAFNEPLIDNITLKAVWLSNSVEAAREEFTKIQSKYKGLGDGNSYTTASWTPVSEAYTAAETEYNESDNASAGKLITAIAELEKAIQNLITDDAVETLKTNYQNSLKNLPSEEEKYLYTADSWSSLENAKAAANEKFGVGDEQWAEDVEKVTAEGTSEYVSYATLQGLVAKLENANTDLVTAHYTVTFASNGNVTVPESISVEADKTIEYDDKYELTRYGYTFAGWYDENGDEFKFNTLEETGTIVKGNMSLTAKWTVKVTIRESASSGSTTQVVEEGVTLEKPDDPTREGFTFDCWCKNEEEYDFDTPVKEAFTLEGKWKVQVTFNLNGGSMISSENEGQESSENVVLEVREGSTVEKVGNPKKEDYVFMGWYLGNADFDFRTPVTQNITLKAAWVTEEIRAELDDVINDIPGYNPELKDYTRDESHTTASLDVLSRAFLDFESAIGAGVSSDTELEDKIEEIKQAKEELVKDEKVQTMITNFKAQQSIYETKWAMKDKYTQDTQNTLGSAYSAANSAIWPYVGEGAYENVKSLSECNQMIDYVTALENAIKGLRSLDTTEQQGRFDDFEGPAIGEDAPKDLYTQVSWEQYEAAYKNAQDNYNATDSAILEEAIDNLELAYERLVLISKVKDKIDEYNSFVEKVNKEKDYYTEESWETISDALEYADGVFKGLEGKDLDTINEEVDYDKYHTMETTYEKLITAESTATKKVYTVKFEPAGGTAVEAQEITAGEKVQQPVSTRNGYTLEGWYVAEATEPYNFNTPVTAELLLTAKWKITDLQAAKDAFDTAKNKWDEKQKDKEYYTPKSWTEAENAYNAASREIELGDAADPEKLQGLVDKLEQEISDLEKIKYAVTFMSDGKTYGEVQYVEIKTAVLEPTPAPVKNGYTFIGWYAEGTTVAYNFSTPVTKDITLIAKWEITSLQEAQDAFLKAEEKWNELQESKGDYTEESWNAAEDAYNVAKAEANKGPNANLENLADLVTKLENAITGLKKKVYAVTFMSDGVLYGSAQTVTIHEKATEPTPAPSKNGYTFKGWFAEGATEAYNFDTPVTANLKLTAKWAVTDLQTAKDNFAAAKDKWEDKQNTKDDYTPESWKEAEDAYNAANAEAALGDAANPEKLQGLVDALNKELGDLVKKTFTVTFQSDGAAYGDVQTITIHEKATKPADPSKEGYTFKGWYAEGATEAYNFDTPVTANLVLDAKWDITTLQAAKDSYAEAEEQWNSLQSSKDKYTSESWKEAEDAYKAAAEEFGKENPDADKLQGLVDAWKQEMGDLDENNVEDPLQAAKDEFKKFEELYQNLNKDDFTEESWKAFEDAYQAVLEELAKGEDADLDKLADLMSKLEDAYNNLVPVEDSGNEDSKAALEEAMNAFRDLENQLADLNQDDYTPESWQALKDAYNAAKAEFEKGNEADPDKLAELNEAFRLALADLQLNIIPASVSSIKITGISKKIAAGKKVKLTANISPVNAANKAVTWSSSNKKYATVNSKGVVKTKKAGKNKKVTITATAADGSGVVATYKIKIMQLAVKKVKILSGSQTVKAGKSIKLTSEVTPKASKKKINAKLQWTSSNTKYATVNAKGVVKTKKAGKNKTVKITAKATDGSNKKAVFKLKITK